VASSRSAISWSCDCMALSLPTAGRLRLGVHVADRGPTVRLLRGPWKLDGPYPAAVLSDQVSTRIP
jgi:hypothetical protein